MLAVQELRTPIGEQSFSFATDVPSQTLVFEAMVGGATLATAAPSNLPNYDPTAESWSSIRICVRPNPAPVVFSPEPADRLAARRRFYHGSRISKEHDACLKAPASRSRYSLQFLAEPFYVFNHTRFNDQRRTSTPPIPFGIVMSARDHALCSLVWTLVLEPNALAVLQTRFGEF